MSTENDVRADDLRDWYAEDDPNGAELLNEVWDALARYVVFPSNEAAIATTLWIAATHALPSWQHATRLVIVSPQKRCGKSRLLDIIAAMVFQPMLSSNASTAAIFRLIGDDATAPTLLIDEADALFGTRVKAEQNEDLRGLLNAGFQRGRTVFRCVGPSQTPTEFATFAMVALAAIKSLPDTITDRAVVIDLKRRRADETVERYRLRRDEPKLAGLRRALTAWARDPERLAFFRDAEPAVPAVEDRQQDAWEPLLAVADAAGGPWPELGRIACTTLCGREVVADDDLDRRLLLDIRSVFGSAAGTFLTSQALVNELRQIEESPWGGCERPLTVYRLAEKLRPYGVRPDRGPGQDRRRGYDVAWFADAFERFL